MPVASAEGGIAIRFKGELRKARLPILVLMALLFVGLAPMPPVQATTITAISPTQGPVGTTVTVFGENDVLGGDFHVLFDATLVAFGATPVNSDSVIASFVVPAADEGVHDVTLVDNVTTATDSVTFLVSAQPVEAVQDVADVLQSVVDTNSGTPLADKVEGAAAKAQTAVDELSKTPADNQAAVGNIEGSVGDLIAAVNDGLLDPDEGNDLMNQFAAIAREIAQTALNQATACDPTNPDLAVAQESLDDGDTLKASGLSGAYWDFKDAINAYKDALSKAEGILGAC